MERPDYSILDRPEIIRFMFYPRADHRPPPQGASDIIFMSPDGTELCARFYAADKDSPTILFFHGNGEVTSDYDDIADLYNKLGINLFVTDYRGYGRSKGTPTISNLVEDSHSALAALLSMLEKKGFSSRIYAMGRSLGAYSAIEIAAGADDKIKGFIIESGSADVSAWLRTLLIHETPAITNLVLSHWKRIKAIKLPLLTIHGQVDTLVPIKRSRELFDAVSSSEKHFVIIEGAGHNDIMFTDTTKYLHAIRDFVLGRE